MKALTIIGVVMIVLGILVLVYHGIPTKSERDVVRVGPVEAVVETKKTMVVPPVVGWLAVASGAVLVVVGLKKRSST